MSILFSRQCEYALQATSYLALRPAGEKVSTRELSRKLQIPYYFLGKIFQRLVNKKILLSQKGPFGGFSLALPPDEISLYTIVEAIDGNDLEHNCVMGFPNCSQENPCATHTRWKNVREEIISMLREKKLSETAKSMKRPEYLT